ncbi:hypothetical protein RDWZM_009109 [Blomia tropicalis]|uniref:Ig-like domain-containing protein n=1 Tax=Blomia tropicalis TaxID=40697 RepID=A0A9Q0M5R9_BLOTA|nr:hypothetical protein RDWZM_009109 [Blomia tropicalis]
MQSSSNSGSSSSAQIKISDLDPIPSSSSSVAFDSQSEEDECRPKDYDLMKEKVLNKINDVSLLFARLDGNNDGQITLNELWKHSMIYKSPDSSCLLTDLMQHEDTNSDEKLDYSEFQSAFNKLFSVTMVTLDESLAINRIDAHLGDNVEIRCDINGEPQRPAIKWYRHGVDLSSLNLPYIKVFGDGSLYLTDLQQSFSGNYSCQAVNNPTVKQTHIVRVLINPLVEVSPRFQWAPIGGVANFECRYETFDDDYMVQWFKNDEQLNNDEIRTTIMNNGTRLQVAALEQSDTGAYMCKVTHPSGSSSPSLSMADDGTVGQSVASLLVQDEAVEAASAETRPQRLWIFHSTGLSIYEGICGQPIHEIDGRDIIYQQSVTLCGGNGLDSSGMVASCQWSDDVVVLDDHVFIAQPNLNRIVVFQASQLTVVQVIATDTRPSRLWAVEPSQAGRERQIWIICDGAEDSFVNSPDWPQSELDDLPNEKYVKNRKTIQVVRWPSDTKTNSGGQRRLRRQADVIHLQPVDGHFDLVYDLFMPNHYETIFKSESNDDRVRAVMQESSFGYATHWEERSLVKISLQRLEYLQSIRLADCQPIAASIITRRFGGLVAVQCQTPVTHQLNGQLILDQVTDAILTHNQHLNAHENYLSPDHRYLVNILHESSDNNSSNNGNNGGQQAKTSTIIVQRINSNGIEFLYDVRTSLNIVNCVFVWKNGNYDLVLASGTHNREDLLYLSLADGHVELITGIGRPTEGYHRGLALSTKNRVLSITATESVYTVDLNTNRILCESSKHFEKPRTLVWTN